MGDLSPLGGLPPSPPESNPSSVESDQSNTSGEMFHDCVETPEELALLPAKKSPVKRQRQSKRALDHIKRRSPIDQQLQNKSKKFKSESPTTAGGTHKQKDIRSFFAKSERLSKSTTASPGLDKTEDGNVLQIVTINEKVPSAEVATAKPLKLPDQPGTSSSSTTCPQEILESSSESVGSKGSEDEDSSSEEVEEEYEVEKIEDFWVEAGVHKYLIKWKGWPASANTWEPAGNLVNCDVELLNFYKERLGEVEVAKITFADNKRKLIQTLKKLPVPPDPRPLTKRIDSFLEETGGYKDEEVKEALEKVDNSKNTVPTLALEQALLDAEYKRLKEDSIRKLRFQCLLWKAETQQKELKLWEKQLNRITLAKPKITVENEVDFAGPPADFTYINDYVPGEGVIIPNDPPIFCEDGHECSKETDKCCLPTGDNIELAYNKYKRVKIPPWRPIFECNKKCKCSSDCVNRVVQDGWQSLKGMQVCIFRTNNNRGWGVKTLKPIKKGTFVTLYAGEIIKSEEADRRGKIYDQEGITYLFDLDFNEDDKDENTFCLYTIDAAKMGNVSHFINHSCDPNLVVHNVWVDCLDPNLPKLALFASKEIAKDQELTFDYLSKPEDQESKDKDAEASSTSSSNGAKKPCLCGADNCRKILF